MAVKPSIALIPSAYKASKVYSVLPSDGTGDFDFSRSGQATRINKDGLIETVDSNIPRLNYPMIDGVVSGCPSLLLEPARTNLLTHSEDFSNASWIKTNSTVTANSTISPKGDLSADTFELTGSAGRLQRNVTLSDNTDYTLSSFVKPISVTNDLLSLVAIRKDGTVSAGIFNVSTGVVDTEANCTAKIEPYSNGYFRLSITYNSLSGGTTPSIRPISNSTGNGGFTTGDSVYIWGTQLEQGSYPTSYIPTNGSSATRSAETCNNSGDANTFKDSEGVLFAEFATLTQSPDWGVISITNGVDVTHWISMFISGSQDNTLRFDVRANSSYQMQYTFQVNSIDTFNKYSILYKENDLQVWSNGFKLNQVNVASVPSEGGLVELAFDRPIGNIEPFYGNTKQIQYFDTALNDTDLETLTSWTSFNEMAQGQLYTIQ